MKFLATILATSLLLACGGSDKGGDTTPDMTMEDKTEPAQKTLFERLGGQAAITAVVDEFVANVVADDRINQFFAKADADHLKKMLVEQICAATGGPCKYTGKSMVEAHKGMGVSDADFTALVEDLIKALETLEVPEAEKNELLGALGGMKGDIVEK